MADQSKTRNPSKRKPLTAERVRQELIYDPQTGIFERRNSQGQIGCITRIKKGHAGAYRKIGIGGKQHFAHRLVWLYVYGHFPSLEIDHINGDGLDNRLCNLRLATPAQNRTNSVAQKSSKTGLRGVHYHPGAKRYRAQICKNNKTYHIGYFDTPEEAHAAYLKAARALHGEFVREPIPEKRMAG